MSHKEGALPLSTATVSALVAALLCGHLLLPNTPQSVYFPFSEVIENAEDAMLLEVPSSTAGQAMERRRESAEYGQASSAQNLHAERPPGAVEELQALWNQGIARTAGRAGDVPEPTAAFLISLLCVAGSLGLLAFVADLRDAEAEEDSKRRGEATSPHVPEAPSWPFMVLLLAGACAVAHASYFPHSSSSTDVATSVAEAELHLLLRQAPRANCSSDSLVAAVLALWVALGLWAALTDVREMRLEAQKQPCKETHKRTKTVSARNLQCVLRRLLYAAGAVMFVAVLCGLQLATRVFIAGTSLLTTAADQVELQHIKMAALQNLRWAPSDEATAAVLAMVALLALLPAQLDANEEAERLTKASQEQPVRAVE